jgi:hypothetical protein
VGLGVLADALSSADHVVEGDVDQAAVEVDVADLQAALLTAADTGDHHQPQVQPQSIAARAGQDAGEGSGGVHQARQRPVRRRSSTSACGGCTRCSVNDLPVGRVGLEPTTAGL